GGTRRGVGSAGRRRWCRGRATSAATAARRRRAASGSPSSRSVRPRESSVPCPLRSTYDPLGQTDGSSPLLLLRPVAPVVAAVGQLAHVTDHLVDRAGRDVEHLTLR